VSVSTSTTHKPSNINIVIPSFLSSYYEKFHKVCKYVPFEEPMEPEPDQPTWDSSDIAAHGQEDDEVDEHTVKLLERNWSSASKTSRSTAGGRDDDYAAAAH
jgi:hypothetical protein